MLDSITSTDTEMIFTNVTILEVARLAGVHFIDIVTRSITKFVSYILEQHNLRYTFTKHLNQFLKLFLKTLFLKTKNQRMQTLGAPGAVHPGFSLGRCSWAPHARRARVTATQNRGGGSALRGSALSRRRRAFRRGRGHRRALLNNAHRLG